MRHSQLTEDLQEQASLYAAGAMPEHERMEYARHLEEDQCAVCRAEVNELQSAIGMFAFSLPERAPSEGVRERLLEQARNLAATRPAQSFVRRHWLELVQSTAIAALIFAFVTVTRENGQLRRLTGQLVSQISQLETQVAQQRTFLASLTSPGNRVIDLAGTGTTAGAKGRLFWDTAQRKWLFYVQDLPRVPDDRIYQLWFVPKTGNPVSAVAFNTEADGSFQREIQLPEGLTDLKLAAVTTEPAPEQPQPTGPFALLSPAE